MVTRDLGLVPVAVLGAGPSGRRTTMSLNVGGRGDMFSCLPQRGLAVEKFIANAEMVS